MVNKLEAPHWLIWSHLTRMLVSYWLKGGQTRSLERLGVKTTNRAAIKSRRTDQKSARRGENALIFTEDRLDLGLRGYLS